MKHMKSRRQVDQLVVFIKILKAGDEQCLKMLKKVLNEISALIPIYKGESNPLNLSSYSIWLLEHAFKLYERVLEKRLRKIVNMDRMQCGFMPGSRQWMQCFFREDWQKKLDQKQEAFSCFFHLERFLINYSAKEIFMFWESRVFFV